MISYLSRIYLILIFIAPLTPRFGSADKTITQWITLSIAAVLGLLITFFIKSKFKFDNHYLKFPFYFYLFFILIAFTSYFFAINRVESIIALSRIMIVLSHLYVIYTLKAYKIFSLNKILLFVCSLLTIEIILSLSPLYNILRLTKDYDIGIASQFLLGIEGNKNITSASIIVKMPFLILLIERSKHLILKYFLITILFFGVLTIYFLSARATLLSLLIVFFVIIAYRYQEKKIAINLSFFKNYKYLLIVPIFSYLVFSNFIPNNSKISLNNRIESVTSYQNDNSIKQRLRYYSQAVNHSFKNPLMGVGIGNWKIIAIKLDSKNITSYVVPNVLHNDFLEILGETNILGMLSYLLFFMSLIYILIKNFNFSKDTSLLTFLALLAYIIDSSLNFPLYRASMQVNLLIIFLICLIISQNNYKINDEE